MAYDRHRAGARGEALAVAWLTNRDWYGPNSKRPEGLTAAQKRSGIKLMVVNYDGQIDLDPEWSKHVVRKDRSARAKAKRDEED